MSLPRITLLGSQDSALRDWLTSHSDGHERAVFLLFRKLDRNLTGLTRSPRYVLVDTIRVDGEWLLDSSRTHLTFSMRMLPALYFRCETEGLELGFAHSHPSGHTEFSARDEVNEKNILSGLRSCNGGHVALISMILVDDAWIARIRNADDPDSVLPVRHVSALAESIALFPFGRIHQLSEILQRQEAAFGHPFTAKMKSLRVAVIGAGGVGSAVATLLARAGVGELIIMDGDKLETSNLNRVRGPRRSDTGNNKAEILARVIQDINVGTNVVAINEFLTRSSSGVDALSTVDVAFGCTDDVGGRDVMNQAMYYYGIVLIDCGLTGKVDLDAKGLPYLRDHRGRVSCILPEYGACLRCQGVISDSMLKFEQELKRRPELAKLDPETLRREYYLEGGAEQAPGVGPFTSGIADNAVATLMDLLRPYRNLPTDLRRDNIWFDFVHLNIHSNEPKVDTTCIYCKTKYLLLRKENGYRLDMPILGKY